MSVHAKKVEFRPLEESDLPLLHRWLNQDHMRAFYQKETISLEAVTKKYTPRIKNEVPTLCHIAMIDGKPFGKIQCYRVADYPKFAQEIGVSDGISVDLFIGEPQFLGKGFGASLLEQYLKEAFSAFPSESRCYICHEIENVAALGCTKSVGFRSIGAVVEEGVQCELFVMER